MIIPLDLIYHYLDDIINDDLVIYHQYPFGSKKIEDQRGLNDYSIEQFIFRPMISFFDQEPMMSRDQLENIKPWAIQQYINDLTDMFDVQKFHQEIYNYIGAAPLGFFTNSYTIFDHDIIVGSQKLWLPEKELEEENLQYVYYWFHGLAARDWYRYAMVDPKLCDLPVEYQKDFLIYNRAWSGTREYRLFFTQCILDHDLHTAAEMRFASMDQDQHYLDHKFKNLDLSITRDDLHLHFLYNDASPDASASYSWHDYHRCAIDIILETVFDTNDIFLTEKILRPIACGKPFLLAGPPGSLQYLRNYGFDTFGNFLDESYDVESDSKSRLQKIVQEMHRISKLSSHDKIQLWKNLHDIANKNKKRFWSDDFFTQVISEYKTNVEIALDRVKNSSNSWKTNFVNLLLVYHPELKDQCENLGWLSF